MSPDERISRKIDTVDNEMQELIDRIFTDDKFFALVRSAPEKALSKYNPPPGDLAHVQKFCEFLALVQSQLPKLSRIDALAEAIKTWGKLDQEWCGTPPKKYIGPWHTAWRTVEDIRTFITRADVLQLNKALLTKAAGPQIKAVTQQAATKKVAARAVKK